MQSEVRMEVVSYEEAVAYCNANGLIFDHIYEGKLSNAGKLMMLAYKETESKMSDAEVAYYQRQIELEEKRQQEEMEKKYGYRLFTYHGNSKMYCTKDRSVSPFLECNALIINKRSDAERKALFMNSYGRYKWYVEKVRK